MDSIQILLDEHKLVERVIKLVEKVRSKLKKKKEVPAPTFWKLVDFIQSYADVIHHSKEEDVLFEHVRDHEDELSDKVQDQIHVLIDEHIQGLDLANEMHKAIREYQRGKDQGRRRILRAVNTYVDMMKAHFKSEEDDVFPALVKVLSKSEKDRMVADFKRFDKLVGGTAAHQRYQKIVEELEKELK